jgi:hypothetical protein
VLWIDILVRLRISRSVPLPYGSELRFGSRYGSGSGSCFFLQWLTRCQQKISFFFKVFCLLLFEVNLHNFHKSKRSHKIEEIKVFLTFFCLLMERSGSGSRPVQNNDESGSGRPKNIRILRTDPHPGPQHCLTETDLLLSSKTSRNRTVKHFYMLYHYMKLLLRSNFVSKVLQQ